VTRRFGAVRCAGPRPAACLNCGSRVEGEVNTAGQFGPCGADRRPSLAIHRVRRKARYGQDLLFKSFSMGRSSSSGMAAGSTGNGNALSSNVKVTPRGLFSRAVTWALDAFGCPGTAASTTTRRRRPERFVT